MYLLLCVSSCNQPVFCLAKIRCLPNYFQKFVVCQIISKNSLFAKLFPKMRENRREKSPTVKFLKSHERRDTKGIKKY